MFMKLIGVFVGTCALGSADVDDVLDLPDVDSVLQETMGTQEDFVSQVAAMQAQVKASQLVSVKSLSERKQQYENTLANQSIRTEQILKENEQMREAMTHIQKGNEAILVETKRFRVGNRLLRAALEALSPKLCFASDFLVQGLNATEVSNAEELEVLVPPAPEPTLSHFLDVMGQRRLNEAPDENGAEKAALEKAALEKAAVEEAVAEAVTVAENGTEDGKLSLLEVGSRPRARGDPQLKGSKPEDFVPILSVGLENLAKAQEEGLARLKAQYLAQLELGQKKQDEALKVQERIKNTTMEKQARQKDLYIARAAVERLHSELRERIQGVRVFMQRVMGNVADTLEKAHTATGSIMSEVPDAKLADVAAFF